MQHHTFKVTCRVMLAAVAVAAAAPMSGCGSDSDEPDEVVRPAAVTLADADPASGAYVIEARRPVSSGAVRISVRNPGTKERGAQLIRVEGEHDVAEAFAALNDVREGSAMPTWLRWAGGIGVIRPGASVTFTVDLAPGSYYAVDRSFQGKSAQLASLGERARLDVRQAGAPAPMTTPVTAITATEYAYRTSGLAASDDDVLLENRGKQPHDFVLSPIVKGRTLEDVKAFATGEDESGPPPVDFENEVISGVLDGGSKQTMRLGLKPGRYALICFASDRRGGPPHVARGMVTEVTVR